MSEARSIETDDGHTGTLDDKGRLVIELPDGGTIYRVGWKEKSKSGNTKHGANLALTASESTLFMMADDLLRDIEADDMTRREYLETLAKAIEMLGVRMEDPKSSADDSSAPLEGMSSFRHPLLFQTAIRFQADFQSELLPADGPVKIRDDSLEAPSQTGAPQPGMPGMAPSWMNNSPPESEEASILPGVTSADLADALEKDMNHYLTRTASEYYPDTTRMAFLVGLMGGGFKKVYHCPLRKRPVSESIEIKDLIVDHGATDLRNAARVTHRIMMRHSMVRRMMKAGVYRDVALGDPIQKQDVVEQAIDRAMGMQFIHSLPSSHQHLLYECATEWDLEDDGEYLPYKITIDVASRNVLSIYRNWDRDDKLKQPRTEIVKYSYIDALGFYPLGLVHVLGNTVRALTAAFREFLDAGMFANFPGFLYSADAGKQLTNQFRVAPGSGAPIQTGGQPIANAVMPLPYKSPDAGFMQFIQHVEESGRALGGEASVPLSEGTANMPVGTMLAQIEQALKPIKGVFKGLHRSQAEEFQLLKQRFREDPEALWRGNPKPARQWEVEEFLAALDKCELVPMADPNTASQVQRIAVAWAMLELAKTAPYLFHERDTALRFMRMIGIPDPDGVLASAEEIQQAKAAMAQQSGGAGAHPPNPALDAAKAQQAQADAGLKQAQTQKTMVEAQSAGSEWQSELADKAAERQFKASEVLTQSHERAADRQSHLEIAHLNAERDRQKAGAGMVKDAVRGQTDQQLAEQERAHEAGLKMATAQHEQGMAQAGQEHDIGIARHHAAVTEAQAEAQRQHDVAMSERQAEVQTGEAARDREHQQRVAKLKTSVGNRPAAKKKGKR